MRTSIFTSFILLVTTGEHASAFISPVSSGLQSRGRAFTPVALQVAADRQDSKEFIEEILEEGKIDALEETRGSASIEEMEETKSPSLKSSAVGDTADDERDVEIQFMTEAIELAQSGGSWRSETSPFPNPMAGAVLVSSSGEILGKGMSDYNTDAVLAAIDDAGIKATPLAEWCVDWPSLARIREEIASSALYVTLEPSSRRRGEDFPSITDLIAQTGISRVVIGCVDPIPEYACKGAAALHAAGVDVHVLSDQDPLKEECEELIEDYAELTTSKLMRIARKQYQLFGRPLGFLHCSVVDSHNVEAFARQGNAFGTKFGEKTLSSRDVGAFEIAPPPEVVWASDEDDDDDDDDDDGIDISDMESFLALDFDEEDFQGIMKSSPMMPWYEQVDAVVATLQNPGVGPAEDGSLSARLNGLKWLASQGKSLPAGVERILVMDATDLSELPLTNDDPDVPAGVDIEAFWAGEGRKPTRILLRRGANAKAAAAAEAAAVAAQSAADAAKSAKEAIETGDAARAAEAAVGFQEAAFAATTYIQDELQAAQMLKSKLTALGVRVETLEGGDPIDVMNHLGKRSGLTSVCWRAGCWGEKGVDAILKGAFQYVSAHLAVDAVGGKFWQLMLAESAVQAALGPNTKVKIFSDQEDVSLEYCDQPGVDKECSLTIAGRPVRHIRLDCRVALVDAKRKREFVLTPTKQYEDLKPSEQAPWFL